MACQTLQTFFQIFRSISCAIKTRTLPILWWKNSNTLHLYGHNKFIREKREIFKKTIYFTQWLKLRIQNLMKYRVMCWINRISTINISSYKKMIMSPTQNLSLMGTSMASQNSLGVNIVSIIITPTYMISRNQDIIKILQ